MSKVDRFPRPGIAIRLAETDGKKDSTRIQLARAGEFYHMYYGPFDLNSAMFVAFVENFKAKTYGIDLMIDYDHDRREAAAWFKDLYVTEDGQELWAEVAWTPDGQKAIEDKEFRYLSIDFTSDHIDNEVGASHGPVLYGAALTNRPFIKGMTPTTALNEFHGGINMTLEELKKQNQQLNDRVEQIGKDGAAAVKALNDKIEAKDADIKKLSDENATLKAAAATVAKESEFAKLLSDKKAVPAQKEAFMAGDMAKFASLAGALNEKPEGHGTAPDGEGEAKTDDDKMLALAEEKFKVGGRTMGDCISEAKHELKASK
jgi:phage I-like protein